jgi:hypothetical protein
MDTYIEINNDHELYVWSRMFGITPQELVRLAGEVGPSAERIREALKRRELSNTRGRRLTDDPKRRPTGG